MKLKTIAKGFTLIEMLLVMVIISIILYASINYTQQRAQQQRIDRTSAQMQQILNAALSFYIANGKWPPDVSTLQTQGYLPGGTMNNGWGQPYAIGQGTAPAPTAGFAQTPPLMYVWSVVTQAEGTSGTAAANANAIAGNLPLSYSTAAGPSGPTPPPGPSVSGYSACSAATTQCYAVGMVNIPGQNINNARAVNFAGVYHHGGCVPVPQCPVDVTGETMVPQIMVVPVSVSGVNEPGPSTNVYPISSFTAYATEAAPAPVQCTGNTQPVSCGATGASMYWRVCLQVITELGDVSQTSQGGNPAWGKYATMAAFTRCEVKGEPAGSPIDIFSN